MRRLPRAVTVPAIALLFGGAAAAATGTNPVAPLLDETPTSTTAGSPSTTNGLAEDICETARNHGEAVSSVATGDDPTGADHGAAVSAMARSDCGKHQSSTTTASTTTASTTTAPTTTSAPTTTEASTTTTTSTTLCDDARNHGEAVSAVAKDHSSVGAAHGAAVSAMAHSDCGKHADKDDGGDDADD